MRIVHVVTLVSDDGAFGGPLRVALNHVAEMRRRGHDAILIAGYRGALNPPTLVDGVPVRLFPVRQILPGGFSGLVAVGMRRWLARELPNIDVLHVHAGRDLVTLQALALAQRAQRPFVVQTHGMITPDSRPIARLLDLIATRRLLSGAAERLVLNKREEGELKAVLGSVSTRLLPNGVPTPSILPSRSGPIDVLFLARFHARKRPQAFVHAARALHVRYPHVRWSMVGPDEGELAAVQAAIVDDDLNGQLAYEGALPYDEVASRLSRATVYVLPSVDEPFPMSLLEALRVGVPSVCTTSCGIASQLQERGAALVVGECERDLVAAIDRLLADEGLRRQVGAAAVASVRELFGIDAVVDQLLEVYDRATRKVLD